MPSKAVCKEWVSAEDALPIPSSEYLTAYMISLAGGAFVIIVLLKRLKPSNLRKMLQAGGVAMHKVTKTASEIERKMFHLCSLLIPLIYQVLLHNGYTQMDCAKICWMCTAIGCSYDFVRLHVPFVRDNNPLKSILREKEMNNLCGGSYLALGCTLSIQFTPPAIAMTSIIFLIVGDLSAAVIGRSFGKQFCSMGIGPGGKKSVEGSFAMFLVCMVFGCTVFGQVHLREYAVVIGALVATLAELYEPFGLDDNLSVPVLSSLALTFGFARTYSCDPTRNPLFWIDQNV